MSVPGGFLTRRVLTGFLLPGFLKDGYCLAYWYEMIGGDENDRYKHPVEE